MASETGICNRALQKLGAKRITSLTQDTANARACNVAYVPVRDSELRAHPWNFSIKRATLAADSAAPSWGRARSFQIPSDFIRLLPPYPEDNLNNLDWQIEGQKIMTDDTDPLYIRYVSRITDPNEMDALFQEALSTRLALELCEEITQSNTKKAALEEEYKRIIREARKLNAFENPSSQPPDDEWITVRD
ncbi:MAG TPA: hypothetical protein PK473_03025 [Nitrosomonas sp.]|nr:hypothetical protein [Agitococcus sp.]HNA69983.1 hypothetical protein [Nitrosomonas sp.]